MMIKLLKVAVKWMMQNSRVSTSKDSDEGGRALSSSWDVIPGPAGITDHKFTGCSDPLFYRSHAGKFWSS